MLKLDFSLLEMMRKRHRALDAKMLDLEAYIENNGLPYCDYKLNRVKGSDIQPIDKFRDGVKRIMRILKSYKSSAFADLLKKIQEQMNEERKEREKSKLKRAFERKPQTHEEKVEQMLLILTQKVDVLSQTVTRLENEQ